MKKLKYIKIEAKNNLDAFLDSMKNGSFGAREIGRAYEVAKKIIQNDNCDLIITISGALTIARLGKIIASLVEKSIVKLVITTGALVTHSLVEELGLMHYKVPINISDEYLHRKRLNRIYDSLEPESNLEKLEKKCTNVFSILESDRTYGSYEIIQLLSKYLFASKSPSGLISSCHRKNINLYVPALTDSELGLYLFQYNRNNQKKIVYDPIKDLENYYNWLSSKKQIAILTLGGGVPRNWAQQMIPYMKSVNNFSSKSYKLKLPEVFAAIRICPDSETLGHLSGSTYSEGISWGKFKSKNKENYVEVHSDATIVLPLLTKAILEYIDSKS